MTTNEERTGVDREERSAFEWFDGASKGAYAFPYCSLSRSGSMTFGPAAVEALRTPEAVRLGWDAKARRIGIAAAHPDETGALKMRVSTTTNGEDSGSRSIFARSFLQYYDLVPDENRRYRLEPAGFGLIVLDFDNPLPSRRARRSRRRGASADQTAGEQPGD